MTFFSLWWPVLICELLMLQPCWFVIQFNVECYIDLFSGSCTHSNTSRLFLNYFYDKTWLSRYCNEIYSILSMSIVSFIRSWSCWTPSLYVIFLYIVYFNYPFVTLHSNSYTYIRTHPKFLLNIFIYNWILG